MCSICPRCNPPLPDIHGASFGPLSPILPVEMTEEDWEKIRRFEFPIGGLFCSCPPEDPDTPFLPVPTEKALAEAAFSVPVCPVLPLPVYIDEEPEEIMVENPARDLISTPLPKNGVRLRE